MYIPKITYSSAIRVCCTVMALGTATPGVAYATCGEECDATYSSDIDDCRSQFGDDPADADDLANCVQEARDNYRGCLDDCPTASLGRSSGHAHVASGRLLCEATNPHETQPRQ